MVDVAIVCATADRARADALAEALKARGIEAAPAAADGERATLVLWSAAAAGDGELLRAAERAAARGALISARIDSTPAPASAGAAIDLQSWPAPDAAPAFEKLVQAIAARRGRPAQAATTRARGAPLIRRVLLGVALAALIGLAAAIVTLRLDSNEPAPLPGPRPDFEKQAEEFTDTPGAADRFGLEEEELKALAPREIIILALERTAIETIEAEAARGDTLGRTLHCLALMYGEGLPEDREAARASCTAASASGDALATYLLSVLMRSGQPGYDATPADAERADRLLAEASAAGDVRALVDRAQAALDADEPEAAFAFAERAAREGYGPSFVLIGSMYERGLGVPQDIAQAIQWYARGEQADSPAAMRAMGVLYESGTGVQQDYAQARRRYEAASQRGDAEASRRFASLLERGLGGAADLARAREYYQRAVQQGDPAAQSELTRLGPR
jgi:TPR repeat protein